MRRVQVETPPLINKESEPVDALEAEIEEIALGFEDEEMGEDARDAAEAKIRELSDRIDAIVNRPPVIDDEPKPRIGAFLMLDEHGGPRLDTGLYAEISRERTSGLGVCDNTGLCPNYRRPRPVPAKTW